MVGGYVRDIFLQRPSKDIDVYPEADFTAIVDSEAVTKLVSNLLTNASKYTKDEVTLTCICLLYTSLYRIIPIDNNTH